MLWLSDCYSTNVVSSIIIRNGFSGYGIYFKDFEERFFLVLSAHVVAVGCTLCVDSCFYFSHAQELVRE